MILESKKEELQQFAQTYGLRDDWHEPDEQGVTAFVTGIKLDNAFCEDQSGLPAHFQELVVHLFVNDSHKMSINLASLLAIASERQEKWLVIPRSD